MEWGKREQRKSREWKTSDEKNRARKEKRRSSKRSVERRRGWWGVITGVLRQNGLIVRASWSAAILRRVLGEYSLCVPRLNSYFLSLRVFPLPYSCNILSRLLFRSLFHSPAPVPREQRHETRNRFIIKHGRARFCGVTKERKRQINRDGVEKKEEIYIYIM